MAAVNDPIGDMLTRIRNACGVKKRVVEMPASNVRREIAKILVRRGFAQKFIIVDDGKQGILKMLLKYTDGVPAIQGLARISTPGRRAYSTAADLPRVKSGLGIAIVSTSKGLLTDTEARKVNMGGEVMCKVW